MQVRQAIISCSYKDVFTGTALPNYKWGYGKLDGFSTFTCAVPTGIDNKSIVNEANVFPNPFNQFTTIKLKSEINGDVKIFNAIGELIYSDKINGDTFIVKRNSLSAAGIYFVNVKAQGFEQNYKIIATD